MSTKRRLNNWLESFLQWTLPGSIAKESLLKWSGIFAISATLGRRVVLPRKYLRGWEVYPTMYIVFVGPQGVITKSTSLGYAEKLLDYVPELHKTPSVFTAPVLGEHLVKSQDSSVFTVASEFGALMEKDDKLYTVFTDMFDNKSIYHEETIGRGVKMAENPSLCLLGATTPKWIGMNMSSAVLGGGFGSRVIYIREDQPRQRRFLHYLYDDIDQDTLDQLEADLAHDLNHIRLECVGEFGFDEKATAQFWEDYYVSHPVPPGTHENMVGFYARREAHVAKLAMIHSVATKDELVITKCDLEYAIKEIEAIIPNITKVVTGVGANPHKADAESIQKYIKENGRTSHSELLRAFSAAALPSKLEELINGLASAMLIVKVMDSSRKELCYEINPEFEDL